MTQPPQICWLTHNETRRGKYTREKKNSEFGDFSKRLLAARLTVCVTNKKPTNNPLVSCKTFFLAPREQSGVMGVPVTPLCLFAFDIHFISFFTPNIY